MEILLPTYDKYNFLIPANIACLRDYWPENRDRIVVINGGKKQIQLLDDQGIQIIYTGEDHNYGSNLIAAIDAAIKSEHILIWLDDYMLYRVQHDVVNAAQKLVERPEIDSVRLSKLYTPDWTVYEEDDRFCYIDKNAQYSFSQQAAFWATAAFRRNLREGENPWETELNGSGRIEHHTTDMGILLGVRQPALDYHNVLNKNVFDVNAAKWLFQRASWGNHHEN